MGRTVQDAPGLFSPMQREFFTMATALLGVVLPCCAGAAPGGRDAGALYAELCANCHGGKLEGGKGGSLRGNPWKHGGDDASLARSIRDGLPGAGMPAFHATVTEAETHALIAFLREAATRAIDPQPASEEALPQGPLHSAEHEFRIESVAEGLEVPWSMAFLPDGRLLVTERAGRLRIIENGKLRPEIVGGLPPLAVTKEAGLMSVAAHPGFAENHWLYLSFCDPGERDTAMTKIVRARLLGWQLVELETIFEIPREKYQPGHVLFGGRLVFDNDHLFFSVGVRGLDPAVSANAQDPALANGKIHRVFHDGRIPPDNPFVGTTGAVGSIWALGVRNPQGLARDPRDGSLWETEHGPRGGDELNRIERGKNYGWPLVTTGINYDGTPITDQKTAPGFESPVVDWTPSIAASQIEFYTGDRFPRWKHQLFAGSLATQKLIRMVIHDGRVTHYEEVFKSLGRIRDIKTGPDGLLYLALENIGKPGRVVRLVPAEERPGESSRVATR
jgi:glucose/arabinose dehydrogenase